ncbi:MAG TPA: hypothetical protein VGF25_22945 [Thermoleophilaceae bacterium]|jgi:hypothetical protein
MNDTHTPTRRRHGAGRIALLVGGVLTALTAVGALALGGVALWADGEKDSHGYLSTDGHRFATGTRALASESLDIDLDGAEKLVDTTDLGDIRLKVSSESGKPVFAGIARSDDVAAYLRGVAHSEVTDLDYTPFDATYANRAGTRKPGAPGDQRIWVASTQGTGEQTLDWDAKDGDWSVVVMNADGSSGVAADVKAGAKVPYLKEIGWGGIGGGIVLLLVATGLIVLGGRPPRDPRPAAAAGGLAPAAG